MGGAFNVGGLVTGLDTNNIIRQLLEIERQPIRRIEQRINRLEAQREAVRTLRTALQTLQNRAADFQLSERFKVFGAASSETSVLAAEVTGSPVSGSFTVEVQQLASATSARSSAALGAPINTAVALNDSGIATQVTAGAFSINGVTFNVDPDSDSLDSVLAQINASSAGITATYDPGTDKVTIANSNPGDTSLINFGPVGDGSNFLVAMNVTTATQTTNVDGATEVTSTRNLGAISPTTTLNDVNFGAGPITAGSFSINGVSFTVDPASDSLNDVLGRINGSDAQVSATYDAATDTIRIVSNALGSRTVRFTSGTSNFLDATNLTTAVQEAGKDALFTINGGPQQTRNANEFSDAISGVTLRLLSPGTSTVTISNDDDSVMEDVRGLLSAFNEALTEINNATRRGGAVENDITIRSIQSFLQDIVFRNVTGISGSFSNLTQIGISTGSGFDSERVPQLELDEDRFREALLEDRQGVASLFTNAGRTGVGDQFKTYLDEVTGLNGFLNQRVRTGGSIDRQVELYNARIERLERRVTTIEIRLRNQFSRLEQLTASFQSQGQFLAGLSSNFGRF